MSVSLLFIKTRFSKLGNESETSVNFVILLFDKFNVFNLNVDMIIPF